MIEKKYFDENYNKHIFVIDSWPNTDEKEITLIECINRLKEFDIEILLVGHYPIKSDIQKMVNYYIYDSNNELLTIDEFQKYEVSSGRWTEINGYRVENKNEFHHDYAIWETMRNAFNYCKYLGKEFIHFMEYDNIIDTYQFKQAFIEEIVRNDAVIYEYHENSKDLHFSPYMATYIFSIRTNIALKTISQINNKFEYFTNKPEGWQLERVFLNSLRNVTKSIFLSRYIDNDNELNIHAVWNRDGIFKGDGKFQIYPCVDKDGFFYVHLISGFHDEPVNCDYLVEIRYENFNCFINLKKGTYELIKIGTYKENENVKLYYQGVEVYKEQLNTTFDEYYNLNSVKFKINDVNVFTNFIDGAYVEVNCNRNSNFNVEFIDKKTNDVVYTSDMVNNSWAKPNPKYFVDWKIKVWENNFLIYERDLNYENKRVLISFESKSLGDNLAWIPIVEQFRKQHNCKVICSTFWNGLFSSVYPNIEFVNPGDIVENIDGQYRLGLFYIDNQIDNTRHFNDIKKQPLQKVASDILGLEFIEEKPKVVETKPSELKGKKYVCIAPHATSLAKYWNKPNGWQNVINYLNDNGYDVVYISSESMNDEWDNSKLGGRLKKVINKGGNYPIEDRISDLKGASAFIGLSSGLSWLSWACGTPTILISGFTDKYLEFQDCYRVINKSVCHGCWHNHKLDPGNWRWCPEHEKTDREFECTKMIETDDVIGILKNII
jgi:autotransporter strand-loop-strand O-heptosyltransferase